MRPCIVIVADSEGLARALDRYLRCFLGPRIDSFYTTYERRLLSGDLYRQASLFVLGLFRRDDIGFRAEAIPAAERFIAAGKRTLIISGTAQAKDVGKAAFWDLGDPEPLYERVRMLLAKPAGSVSDFQDLKRAFAEYDRPAVDYHHSGLHAR